MGLTGLTAKPFGILPNNKKISQYTLRDKDIKIKILDLGGIIQSIQVPDRNKKPVDIALGFNDPKLYTTPDGRYVGALIGRCANRIASGILNIDDRQYNLPINNGNNHLHGGPNGFDIQVWEARTAGSNRLSLTYNSPDGEEGYPGNFQIQVLYTLKDKTLTIDYSASCDQDTVCNPTNHVYFNLSGHNSGAVLDQKVQIFANSYTPTNAESIPTGVISPVKGTPMDFLNLTEIGERIDSDFEQITQAKGYDHNWVVNGYDGCNLHRAAYAISPQTGITLTCDTTLPGVQFYTGNYLTGEAVGKDGAHYHPRHGFCLETQFFPNATANLNFESPILRKNQIYHSVTTYKFDVQES